METIRSRFPGYSDWLLSLRNLHRYGCAVGSGNWAVDRSGEGSGRSTLNFPWPGLHCRRGSRYFDGCFAEAASWLGNRGKHDLHRSVGRLSEDVHSCRRRLSLGQNRIPPPRNIYPRFCHGDLHRSERRGRSKRQPDAGSLTRHEDQPSSRTRSHRGHSSDTWLVTRRPPMVWNAHLRLHHRPSRPASLSSTQNPPITTARNVRDSPT